MLGGPGGKGSGYTRYHQTVPNNEKSGGARLVTRLSVIFVSTNAEGESSQQIAYEPNSRFLIPTNHKASHYGIEILLESFISQMVNFSCVSNFKDLSDLTFVYTILVESSSMSLETEVKQRAIPLNRSLISNLYFHRAVERVKQKKVGVNFIYFFFRRQLLLEPRCLNLTEFPD